MDTNALGNDVHNVNVLTVIASESYDSFAKGLQTEMAEAVADRPRAVTPELFEGKMITDSNGDTDVITADAAREIWLDMRMNGYIDNELFKKLENSNIWEFRTLYNGIAYRLFSFWDVNTDSLVIVTHGIIKKSQKTPKKEIEKAERLRLEYFNNQLN
jgi:restriction endonuclease